MYPITQVGKDNFQLGRPQKCSLEITTSNETITITESDVLSLKFTRQSTSSDNPCIGSVIASQLDFTIRNDGSYDNVDFGGAEVNVMIGVKTDADYYYMPIGKYTIDTTPRLLATISISALDRMMLFNKVPGNELNSWLPCTLKALVEHICQTCNVSLYTDISSYPNSSMTVSEVTADTYRELLAYCLDCMGKCAYFDWDGKLRIEWYSDSQEEVDETLRFTSDVRDEVTFGGVKTETQETGTGNKFVIESNPLIDNANLSLLSVNLTYHPFEMQTLPMPYLYPMDGITFVKGENEYYCLITGITFEMNGRCSFQGVGESDTELSYASVNPLTSREKVILTKLEKNINETLNKRVQEVMDLNELVYNAMGFWKTTETNGGTIFYMHDAPNLSESTKVWRMTSSGFTWTDNYQGESTVWQYGVSASGNAWFRNVSAIGLVLASANNEFSSQFTPDAWEILKGSMTAMKVTTVNNEVQMQIPKLVIDDPLTTEKDGYIEDGKIRITPFNVGGVTVGTGIIMLD